MGIEDIAYDCSTARARVGGSAIPGIQEMGFPDEASKPEKLRALGQSYATIRTDGVVEVGDGMLKMTTVAWAMLLSKLPDAFGRREFPITVAQVHPQITLPYSVIWDRCRILGTKHSIDTSEKAGIVEIPISVIMLLHKGFDGVYKTLAIRPGQKNVASLDAQALMF